MTARYVGIQCGVFAAVLAVTSLLFGFGLWPLAAALVLSVAAVLWVVARDTASGRYAEKPAVNRFSALTDAQLRECYDAHSALEHGGQSRSLLFYNLVTQYMDESDDGYEQAASDLLEEVSGRWEQISGLTSEAAASAAAAPAPQETDAPAQQDVG